MDALERIEEHRERIAGLEYELACRDEDAYEPEDPKHPTYADRLAGVWDERDKTERLP